MIIRLVAFIVLSACGNIAPALIVGPYQKNLLVEFRCHSAGRTYPVEVEVGFPRNATATPLPYSLGQPEVYCVRLTKEEVPWKVVKSYDFGRRQ